MYVPVTVCANFVCCAAADTDGHIIAVNGTTGDILWTTSNGPSKLRRALEDPKATMQFVGNVVIGCQGALYIACASGEGAPLGVLPCACTCGENW